MALELKKVENIPEFRKGHDLQSLMKEFIESDNDCVIIKWTKSDYKDANRAYSSIWNAAKLSGYLIKVVKRGNEVYLVRTE